MESSNFMSIPEIGKFQLIPGTTNLLFPFCLVLPPLLSGISFLAPPVTSPWHEELLLCEPDGSLGRYLCWRVRSLPSQEREVTGTLAPMSRVRRQLGLALRGLDSHCHASSPEALKEFTGSPGLWNGILAQCDSWARTMSGWFLETWVRVTVGQLSLPASVFRLPCCQ